MSTVSGKRKAHSEIATENESVNAEKNKIARTGSIERDASSLSIKSRINQHTEATENLLSTIDAIVDANRTDLSSISELLEEAAIHFMTLKSTQREANLLLEQKSRKVQQRKMETEEGHLILQNLAYEKNHLLREIAACRDFHTTQLHKMAMEEAGVSSDKIASENTERGTLKSESETTSNRSNRRDSVNVDQDEVTKNFVGHDVRLPKDRTTHQNILDFITLEIQERKELKQKLEDVKNERKKVEKETESKRKFLANLPEQLNVLEMATLPLQQYLGLQSSARKKRFSRASKLCRPLYILCCQLEAFADAFDSSRESMTVEITNAVQYGEAKNEGKHILKADPLAVVLRLKSMIDTSESTATAKNSEKITEILFQYLPSLNVVTAEATEHPQLLVNLFPGDHGATTPNLSSFHECTVAAATSSNKDIGSESENVLKVHEENNVLTDMKNTEDSLSAKQGQTLNTFPGLPKDFPGRPYMWAQWLAGLCFLNDSQKQERLEPSTRAVIRQLHRRVRAQRTLKYLLSTLNSAATSMSSNKSAQMIPIHPAMNQLFPANAGSDSASLVGWTEVVQKVSQIKPHFGYSALQEEGNADTPDPAMACRFFRARLMHQGRALNAFVEVSPEYPAKAPRWLLQATPLLNYQEESISAVMDETGSLLLHDNNMKLIETTVNAEYDDLILAEDETTLDWILVHQLRKIMTCWAALSDGPEHGSIAGVRVRRGRNRRKALAFERYPHGKK